MDSHEEKVYQAVRATQEREAKQTMRERAKELQVKIKLFKICWSHLVSGQTKQVFGRNTETETGPSEKAEILAETEISADTLFRPKQPLLADIYFFSVNILAKYLLPK